MRPSPSFCSQFRIAKLGGTQVEIGSLNNILNQEVVLQVGAAGATAGTNNSGRINAKQTQLSPPKWNLSLSTYNGTDSVEAITISPEGVVSIPSLTGQGPNFDSSQITNLTAPGLVKLGTSGGASTVIKGNLQIDGTLTGGGITVGVQSATLATPASNGLAVSQVSSTGAVTMNVDVATLNEIPLVTEVTSWNALIGTAGGAAKADKLTTARLIWGQSFDGTADVSGALTNVTSVTASGVPLELTSDNQVRLSASGADYRFKSTGTAYGILRFSGVSADRTYTMPNASGTVALLSDIAGSSAVLNVAQTFTAMQTFSAGLTGALTGNADTATTADNSLLLGGLSAGSPAASNTVVARDATGNFAAGTITANLTGTASNATTAADALLLNGVSASTSTVGTIVQRDATGDFTANIITASLNGNAATVTDGVTTNTAQTITGVKTFNGITKLAGNVQFTSGDDMVFTQNTGTKAVQFFIGSGATAEQAFTITDTLVSVGTSAQAVQTGLTVFGTSILSGTTTLSGNTAVGSATQASTLEVFGEIFSRGDITAFYTSDERLKENITPIPNALAKVASISGNTFDWNDKSDKEGSETGVIAQEVESLGLPDVVTTRDNGYKAVRYEKLVPLLIEAIKELKEEVDELKQWGSRR